MVQFRIRLLLCFFFGVSLVVTTATADAQQSVRRSATGLRQKARGKKSENKTKVIVEILTGDESIGFRAQRWRPTLEKLGYAMKIRRGTSRDKIETREKKFGRLREVYVIGKIDRDGRLIFADHSFSLQQTQQLAAWLRELETYGAQGTPKGKPLWGLEKSQFDSILKSLSVNSQVSLKGLDLKTAIKRLELPLKIPLRITTTSETWLRTTYRSAPPVQHALKNTSKGTALAIVLNEYGLGFRPLRTPSGTIELVVDPLTKSTDVWPIGWEPKQKQFELVPKLFEVKLVEIDNLKLVEVFTLIQSKTDVPLRVDNFGIQVEGLDLNKTRVSHPLRKTSWSLALRRVINPHKIRREIRVDELGHPFLWITTLAPKRPQR